MNKHALKHAHNTLIEMKVQFNAFISTDDIDSAKKKYRDIEDMIKTFQMDLHDIYEDKVSMENNRRNNNENV